MTPEQPRWTGLDDERREVEPWYAAYAHEDDPAVAARRAALASREGYELHPRSVVAAGAHVAADRLAVGDRTTIAADCTIRGEVRIGAHCSLNAGASTIGRVTIGDLVRIAGTAVLVGENHVIDDLDRPIAVQGLTSKGIVVEDDVWIGAHTTILDGVTVGAHSVVAAGAVVTRDVPPWSIVAGVPARVVRDRRSIRAAARRRDALAGFDDKVQEQWPAVLARCETTDPGGRRTYVDVPGDAWGPRPLNDAVEIAGAFGAVPPVADHDELVARIQALQDESSGMFVDPRFGPATDPLRPSHREWDHYGIISCGYALEVLGAAPLHPVHAVEHCDTATLERLLDRLDWALLAWPSGSWVDAFGTAMYLNRRHHGSTRQHPMLWGWLATHVDRASGMWGRRLEPAGEHDWRWLMAVNGWYRLTRGTYAQFGMAVPHPEAALDTVLTHAEEWDWFERDGRHADERNACNVLDVMHPLWLLHRQTDHRASEVRDAAARVLDAALGDWVDGSGVPWLVGRDDPGLQGTEMWLSIVFLAADVLGEADALSWKPRGVHRLEPVDAIGR